jgi:hypothetical protein
MDATSREGGHDGERDVANLIAVHLDGEESFVLCRFYDQVQLW